MAIAYTNSAVIANWSTANPATASFDCSGGDILFVGVFGNGAMTAVSATYNGVAMTQLFYMNGTDGGSNDQVVFYLVNPASGSNTLSVSRTGGANLSIVASSYSGVDTTTPIDAYSTEGSNSTATTHASNSTTVGSSNNWLVGLHRDTDLRITTADILTIRASTTTVSEEVWDSNGTVSAGSHTVTYTLSPAGRVHGVSLISINAAATATNTTNFFYMN